MHRERGETRRRGETQEERSRWGQERTGASLLKGVIMWGIKFSSIFWGKRVQCSMKTFCNGFITSNILHSGKKSVCSETNLLKWFIWTSKNFLTSRTWIISKWTLTFNTYEKFRNSFLEVTWNKIDYYYYYYSKKTEVMNKYSIFIFKSQRVCVCVCVCMYIYIYIYIYIYDEFIC